MKKKLIPILIIVGIFVILGIGYLLIKDLSSTKEISNKDSTNSQDEEIDEDTDNSTNEGSFEYDMGDTTINIDTEEKEWPSDIPSNIPEFKYGDIETVSTATGGEYVKTWSVIYSNTSESSFTKYKSDLEKVGFETVSSLRTTQGSVATVNKDPVTMVITYMEEEKRTSVSITETLE
jgi:hypothetical protein